VNETCTSCGSGRLVPVLDVRLTQKPNGGNPYRVRCLECSTRFGLASKQDWKHHTDPHVLPLDADHEQDGSVIPLREWDRADEYDDIIDRAGNLRADGFSFEVVEPDDLNRFECPNCGSTVDGKPAECPDYTVPYDWT
jgi:predicted RNA-binding Zn-ribbon protein involved in translation (DUF1610 family)